MRTLLLPALLALASCSPSGEPEIQISDAWARPTLAAGQSSAGYLTIRNTGTGDDRLTGATSDVAEKITLHASLNEGGIARMRPITGGVEIAGGTTVHFAPGGHHLMIEKLKRPLGSGERIRLVLQFERSGDRAVNVAVRNDTSATNHAGH